MARKAFLLRVDPALLDELQRWADEELRSLNGQIEYLLRQAVVRRRKRPADNARTPENETPAGPGK